MSASMARETAREAVTRVRERSAFARETLDSLLDASAVPPRDRGFASRLAYGAISSRGTLEEVVARFTVAGRTVEPRVMDALVTAAYEILFMSTPARAAVSQGVELVRTVAPRAAGFANAVLRRVAESCDDFPWGDPQVDDEALARLHAHPSWVARLLIDEYGRELATDTMAADNEPAPLYLATLPFKAVESDVVALLDRDGAAPAACGTPGCVTADVASAAVTSGVLGDTLAIVADAGAQVAAACVPLSDGAVVIDIGAGRGTKSVLIAARAAREALDVSIIAADNHENKLRIARQLFESAGAGELTTVVCDATRPDAPGLPPSGSADAVLVDAPCSGLGTLRRHPDRRWRSREDEPATLAAIGSALLRTAAVLVKPGGFVVYSTCTFTRAENDHVIDAFLASEAGAGFLTDRVNECVPEEFRSFVTTSGRFQSLPAPGGPDGHFVARLKRVS